MFTADCPMKQNLASACVLLTLFFACAKLVAHPVAQGAIDVSFAGDHVRIRATVSAEEVLVAHAMSTSHSTQSETGAAVREHGSYLLRHLRLTANDAMLEGIVVHSSNELSPQLIYELEYALPRAGSRRVRLSQNVLREFEFAPGNRWEASYILSLNNDGRIVEDGLLLLPDQTMDLDPTLGSNPSSGKLRLVGEFIHHGIRHILTGYDHLLFVSALAFAARSLWDLIKVISTFTLAHTLTLSLSAFNIVRLPEHIVEPMIALSIVVVAAQNVFYPERSGGVTRLIVTFGFGLFHGLGFAGGLLDAMAAMPRASMILALAAFSLGVEIGHQAVVLPLFALLGATRSVKSISLPRHRAIEQCFSGLICVAGTFYFIAAIR